MLVNSLCALALGYVLDMIFGDIKGKFYPINLIKTLIKKLENAIRKRYAESDDALQAAGGMLVFLTLFITMAVSFALLIIGYKINPVVGIIIEGILCWNAISVRSLRTSASAVFRAARSGNLSAAQKRLKDISNRETENLDMDGVIKCAVECVSENTTDWVCAPILWILILGGAGGIFCRCVNILDNAVGYKTDRYKNFGYFAAKLDDIVNFIPSRICAYLMMLDVKFLKLDNRNARRIFYRDRKKSPSPNSAQTQSVCAGALGITIGSDEYYDGQLVRKPEIGSEAKPVEPNDIYWANQLLNGTAAICILLCAVIRAGIFLLIKFL